MIATVVAVQKLVALVHEVDASISELESNIQANLPKTCDGHLLHAALFDTLSLSSAYSDMLESLYELSDATTKKSELVLSATSARFAVEWRCYRKLLKQKYTTCLHYRNTPFLTLGSALFEERYAFYGPLNSCSEKIVLLLELVRLRLLAAQAVTADVTRSAARVARSPKVRRAAYAARASTSSM